MNGLSPFLQVPLWKRGKPAAQQGQGELNKGQRPHRLVEALARPNGAIADGLAVASPHFAAANLWLRKLDPSPAGSQRYL